MAAHAITLHLPEPLYRRYEQRAQWTRRSVETELLDAVASSASPGEELTPELLEAIRNLTQVSDEELWRVATESTPAAAGSELEALHERQGHESLDRHQQTRRESLLAEYDRKMLLRAQAAKLLKERGHDISSLLVSP
jgi:hypothetical protein